MSCILDKSRILSVPRSRFPRYYNSVGYAINLAPTSPQGTMGFALMTRQEGVDFSVPKQGFGHAEARELGLRCYNTEVGAV